MSTKRRSAAIVCASFAFLALSAGVAAAQAGAAGFASEAAKASPALVGELSKEMGSSPEQAAGAAGALFGMAKSKLSPADFTKISSAVPGMDLLLKAAPTGGTGGAGGLGQLGAAAGAIPGAAAAFQKLGLSPDLAAKAIPVITQFVTKSGGADVGKLLAGAFK